MRGYWLMAAALLAAPASAQSVKAGIEAWARADYAAALAAWRPFAAKGNADAMFNLGQAYRLGRSVPIDLAQAQVWYDRAARAGHVDAQTQLGMLLFQSGNRAAGLRWLKAAADKGEARAQLLYGTALFNGDGIARDPLAAYRYVAKSAAQGLGPAKSTLAELDRAMPPPLRRVALAGGTPKPAPSAPAAGTPSILAKPATEPLPASRPTAPAAPASRRGWRVQLGAFSQRSGAEALFAKLGGTLGGKQPYLIAVGAMTRLQAGPFASRSEAASACAALTARGQPCFVVRAPR